MDALDRAILSHWVTQEHSTGLDKRLRQNTYTGNNRKRDIEKLKQPQDSKNKPGRLYKLKIYNTQKRAINLTDQNTGKTQRSRIQAFTIPNTTKTIRRENCESSSDQTCYLDSSLLIRWYQVVGILVLGRLMEFCKQDI
jgi:hypothetical protein